MTKSAKNKPVFQQGQMSRLIDKQNQALRNANKSKCNRVHDKWMKVYLRLVRKENYFLSFANSRSLSYVKF